MTEELLAVTVAYKNKLRNYGAGELIIDRDNTVTNYQGQILVGFRCPDIYASLHTWHLRSEVVEALAMAQGELLDNAMSIVMVDAYRTYEEQQRAHVRKPGLAVSPEQSKHTKGLAVDLRLWDSRLNNGIFDSDISETYGDQDYLAAILEQYDFRRTVMPKEPWHFDFLG